METGHAMEVSTIGVDTDSNGLLETIPLIIDGVQLVTTSEGVYSFSVFGTLQSTNPREFVFIRMLPAIFRLPVNT